MRSWNSLLILFLLLSAACSSATPPVPATQVPAAIQTPLATVTATATAGATATPFPTETSTPIPTDTPVPVTPTATFDPTQATLEAGKGSIYTLSTIPPQVLFNPVGTPLKSWHDVPIMPQVTAGQEFSAKLYSFKAAGAIDQAQQFYRSITKSLGTLKPPVAANGINIHYVYLESFDLTIMLASNDNDPGHVIAIISKVPY